MSGSWTRSRSASATGRMSPSVRSRASPRRSRRRRLSNASAPSRGRELDGEATTGEPAEAIGPPLDVRAYSWWPYGDGQERPRRTMTAMSTVTAPPVGSIVGGVATQEAPGGTVRSLNPADRTDVVAEVLLGDAATFVAACRAARDAQPAWADVPAPVRGAVVGRIGRLVEANKEALARLVTREIGKPYGEALGEVQEIVDTCDFFLGEGRRLYGQTIPSEMPDKQLFTFRVPVGVAAIVTAGNFPVAVPAWYLVPALLCGNAVVWKPAEYAPAIGEALAQLFLHAGLPARRAQRRAGRGPGGLRGPRARARGGPRGQGGLHRLLGRGPADRRALRAPPPAPVPRARRQEPARGHARRRPRPRRGGRALLGLRHRGPALHVARHGASCTTTWPRPFRDRFAAAVEAAPVGDPTTDVLYGPMISERFLERFEGLPRARSAPPPRARVLGHGADHRAEPAPGLRGRPRGRPLLPPHDRGGRAGRGRALPRGDLRPARGRGDLRGPRRGGRAGQRPRLRPLGGDLHARRRHRPALPPAGRARGCCR